MACHVSGCTNPSYVKVLDTRYPDAYRCLDHAKKKLEEYCFDLIYMQEIDRPVWTKLNPEGNEHVYDLNIRSLERGVRRDMVEYGIGLKESRLYPKGEG